MGQTHSASDAQLSDDIFSPPVAANQRVAAHFGRGRALSELEGPETEANYRLQSWADGRDAFHLPRKFWDTDTDTSSNLREQPGDNLLLNRTTPHRARHDSRSTASSVDAGLRSRSASAVHRASTQAATQRLGLPVIKVTSDENRNYQDYLSDSEVIGKNENNYNGAGYNNSINNKQRQHSRSAGNGLNYYRDMDLSVGRHDSKTKVKRNPSSASAGSANTRKTSSTKVSSSAKTATSPKVVVKSVKSDPSPNRRKSVSSASGPLARTESQSSRASSQALSGAAKPKKSSASGKVGRKSAGTHQLEVNSSGRKVVRGRDPDKGSINDRWQTIVDEFSDTYAEQAPKTQQKEHRKVSRITNYRNFSNVEDVLNRKSSSSAGAGAGRPRGGSDVETGSFTSSQSSTLHNITPIRRPTQSGAAGEKQRVSKVLHRKSVVTQSKQQQQQQPAKKKSLSNVSLASSSGGKHKNAKVTKRSSKDVTIEEVAYDVVDEAIQRALKILYGSPKSRRSSSMHSSSVTNSASSANALRRSSDKHEAASHTTSKNLHTDRRTTSLVDNRSSSVNGQVVNASSQRRNINNNLSSSERRISDSRTKETSSAMYASPMKRGSRVEAVGHRRTSIRPVPGSGRMSDMAYGPVDSGEYELNILPYEKEKESVYTINSRGSDTVYTMADQRSKTYIGGKPPSQTGVLTTNVVGSTGSMHIAPTQAAYTVQPEVISNNMLMKDIPVPAASNYQQQQTSVLNGPISSTVYPRPKTISKGSVTKVLHQLPQQEAGVAINHNHQEELPTHTWPLTKPSINVGESQTITANIQGAPDPHHAHSTLPSGKKLTYLRGQGGRVDAIHEGETPLNLHLLTSMPAVGVLEGGSRNNNVNVFLHEETKKNNIDNNNSVESSANTRSTNATAMNINGSLNSANVKLKSNTGERVDFLIDAGQLENSKRYGNKHVALTAEETIHLPPIREETELVEDYQAYSNEPIIVADLLDKQGSLGRPRSRSRRSGAVSDDDERGYMSDSSMKLYKSYEDEAPSVMMNTKQVLNMFLFNHPKQEGNGPSMNYYMAQGVEKRHNGEIERHANIYMDEEAVERFGEELKPLRSEPDPPDPLVRDMREINIYHKQTQTLPSPTKQIKVMKERKFDSLPKETTSRQETTHYITREIERLPSEKVYIASQSVQTDNETDNEKHYSTKSLDTHDLPSKRAKLIEHSVQTDTEDIHSDMGSSNTEMFEEDIVDTRYKISQERQLQVRPPLRLPRSPSPPPPPTLPEEDEEEIIETITVEQKEQKVSMAIFEELEFSFQRSEGGKTTTQGSELISMVLPEKLEPVVDRRKQKCTQIREVAKEGDYFHHGKMGARFPAIEAPTASVKSSIASGKRSIKGKSLSNHMESDGPMESDDSMRRLSGLGRKGKGGAVSEGEMESGRDSLRKRSLKTLKNMPRPNINVYAQNHNHEDDELSTTDFIMQNFEYPDRSNRGSTKSETRRQKYSYSSDPEPFTNGIDMVSAMKEWSSSLERKPTEKHGRAEKHTQDVQDGLSTRSVNLRHASTVDPENVSFVKKYDPLDKLSESEVLTLEQTRVSPTKPRSKSGESATDPIMHTHLERDEDGNIVKVTEVQQSVTKTFKEPTSPGKLRPGRRVSLEELGSNSYVEMSLTDGEVIEEEVKPHYSGPEVLEEVTTSLQPIDYDDQERTLKLKEDRFAEPKEHKYVYDMRKAELHPADDTSQERFFDPAQSLATHL